MEKSEITDIKSNFTNSLLCISPIDGRYYSYTEKLRNYFSEYALIYYRTYIEITYLHKLSSKLNLLSNIERETLKSIILNFSIDDAIQIKELEKSTNHDIKAIEYFIGEKCKTLGLKHIISFIHFGLTSQDINNTAIPLLINKYVINVYYQDINNIITKINTLAFSAPFITILSHTHGQPASPTSFGKELKVFSYRLEKQFNQLKKIKYWAKFGGAVGNFNAHHIAYPNINWVKFSDEYISSIGLERNKYTTQIDNYENLSTLFDNLVRINLILIDMCRDIWSYISMEYLKYKVVENEVGSSTMPHKVNPINFENAEGNLLMANAILTFLSQKLPISRLQRDLTDSTVLRNVGVAFGHITIAFKNIMKGLDKLDINLEKINKDLDKNIVVISEAIQTILRKYNYPNAYEILKKLTRNNNKITKYTIQEFIDSLEIPSYIKQEMMMITSYNYVGYSGNFKIYENLKTDRNVITSVV